jgi:hypothetical protein
LRSDIAIQEREIIFACPRIAELIAHESGKPVAVASEDIARDH